MAPIPKVQTAVGIGWSEEAHGVSQRPLHDLHAGIDSQRVGAIGVSD